MRVSSPCFTPGTLIGTDQGPRPIESLKRGDLLVTRDNGLKRLMWIGQRVFHYSEVAKNSDLTPILIRAGAFGDGFPARNMIVSPQHRFLVGPKVSPLMGGETEALIAARHLINKRSIRPASMLGVTYLHLLMNAHEVILANGAWTESFHPDDATIRGIAEAQRQEILTIFPQIATMGAAKRFPSARPIIKSRFDS
ncbi:Hint domain-containing protein [Rhodobacteraceae bacterium]|nr:Hint domain-containing protein [Paracoccaceae bacterium]